MANSVALYIIMFASICFAAAIAVVAVVGLGAIPKWAAIIIAN